MSTLSAANMRWHQQLDSRYQHFLESLTALEMDTAATHWMVFKTSLTTHIDFEQSSIEPLAIDWTDNTLRLIQSDHLILHRLLPKLDKALHDITLSDKPRTTLVSQLDSFIKMRNVLKHHDVREMEQFYPQLDQQVDSAQIHALVEQMDDLRTNQAN